jgi:hypothetical protein
MGNTDQPALTGRGGLKEPRARLVSPGPWQPWPPRRHCLAGDIASQETLPRRSHCLAGAKAGQEHPNQTRKPFGPWPGGLWTLGDALVARA